MANEWESRTKPQETQQYPAQRIMKEWYEGNFDWKNPRNQYEQTLMKIRRPRSRSRPRTRIYAITRAQQKAIENAQRRGTVIRSSQILTNNLRINAPSPPQQRIRIGSQGEIIGSPFSNSIVISPRESRTSSTSTQSSSQPSRYYSSNSNGYNTPRQ